MRYITNGSRYARFTDDDTCEVWDDQDGWTFPIPADVVKFGPDWRGCDDPLGIAQVRQGEWRPFVDADGNEGKGHAHTLSTDGTDTCTVCGVPLFAG